MEEEKKIEEVYIIDTASLKVHENAKVSFETFGINLIDSLNGAEYKMDKYAQVSKDKAIYIAVDKIGKSNFPDEKTDNLHDELKKFNIGVYQGFQIYAFIVNEEEIENLN